MVLYYALGGGLGHLARARKVLDALEVGSDAVLLTASEFAHDPRVTGPASVLFVPEQRRGAHRRWLRHALADLEPDLLIVDSFPAGVLGELCGLELPPARHVARLLRWPRYAARLDGPAPVYETSYVLEPLHDDHATWLGAHSRRVQPLELPATEPTASTPEGPFWLVVHSGPAAETADLVAHARERQAAEGASARLLVAAPDHEDIYPAAGLFAHAERIVTAAGFNCMREAAPYRDRHVVVPFERPLDDQFERARRARGPASATAATPPALSGRRGATSAV